MKKKSKSRVNEAGNYTKPELRKRLFNSIKAGTKGGKAEYGEMISETRCFIAENKRSSTYNAVVEFINQYNKDESID
jgi:pyoverdine/dityrosine biosynthesis protein Dit1